MKRKSAIVSIVLLVVGFLAARVGDHLATVSENGIVQEHFLTPVGTLLFLVGVLALLIVGLWYLIDFAKSRLKQE